MLLIKSKQSVPFDSLFLSVYSEYSIALYRRDRCVIKGYTEGIKNIQTIFTTHLPFARPEND